MTWTIIHFAPGVLKDDSPLQAQGSYIDADKIRFVNGLPETIYGWERASTAMVAGLCRGATTWQDNGRNAFAAFGTHLGLYAMDLDGTVTDITPVVAYERPSLALTTTDGSAEVMVTGWTHALVIGQRFTFADADVATVGGVSVDGTFVVASVSDGTSFSYAVPDPAAATAGPTAVTVDFTRSLPPGQEDGLAGAGFGTGGFGAGGYGGGGTALTLYPRTWSFDQWGQNLLGSPRGDGIYEWAPHTVAAERVTNGSFSSASGWSVGTGWTVGAGVATASAGATSQMDQTITLEPGARHLLTLNVSVGAGTMAAIAGTSTIGNGITASENYRRPFLAAGGATTLRLLKDSTFAGTLHDVSVRVLTTAALVPNAPTHVGSMFVTAERIVVTCGSNLDGDFDPLQVDWSDAEDNQAWAPSSTNLAGGYTLPAGGRIVRGLAGTRENVIWTTESLWSMGYNGNPNSVYDFIERGRGCGLIGPNAAALVGGVWYWMTPTGAFFAYGGAQPQMLSCSLGRDLKDHLAWVQQDKVYAASLVGKNYAEVWWFYPDRRDGNECSRYVIYDTLRGTWSCGTFDRTAFIGGGAFEYPLATDLDGRIWFHEKGFTADGGPRGWFLTSAFNTQPDGQVIINGVRPDTEDLQGGTTFTFTSKIRTAKSIATRVYPPVGLSAASGEKSIRVKGEQIGFTVAGFGAPTFWRQGALQMDILRNGARR